MDQTRNFYLRKHNQPLYQSLKSVNFQNKSTILTNPLLISTGFFKHPLELKEKSVSLLLKRKFSQFITEFLSLFEMNSEMDISKNQWRSIGGMCCSVSIKTSGYMDMKSIPHCNYFLCKLQFFTESCQPLSICCALGKLTFQNLKETKHNLIVKLYIG